MDKAQEDIQSLSFYGIFRECFTIIFSWKKLFSQITIATIFPLSFLFMTYAQIYEFFFADIVHNEEGFFKNPNKEIVFWFFKIVYVIFFLLLSLLSTSTVVYMVACTYTSKEIDFGEVMSVIPKVWKRVMVTFAWSLIMVLVYNMAAFSLLSPWLGFSNGLTPARIAITGPIFAIYMMGFVYISTLWYLASVVSVLEEDCGIEAMMKSKALVRGKMVISLGVFLLLNLCFILIQVVFQRFVVLGGLYWSRIVCGIMCFLFLSGFTLLGLVIQTLIYLVCKSYSYGISNKLCLGDGVEVYLGDYAPLKFKDFQFDQC